MLFVTFFTLLVCHAQADPYPMTWCQTVTLSESYASLEACEARIPAMILIVEAAIAGSPSLVEGPDNSAACVPVDQK